MNADPLQGEGLPEDVTVVRPHLAGPLIELPLPTVPDDADESVDSAGIAELPPGCMNPLVRAASPLLLLSQRLRQGAVPSAAGHLREQVVAQILGFERRGRAEEVDAQTLVVARYALCATLDEAVLNAPWGERSGWSGKTLLADFHGETYGGEKFFLIVQRLCAHPGRHIDLIELMYLCLALGFSGRYQIEAGGRAKLAGLREDLYRLIHSQREPVGHALAPHWRGIDARRSLLPRCSPWWLVAAAACVLVAALLLYQRKLDALSAELRARVARIGLESAIPPMAAVPRKRLVELLAPEAQAGLLWMQQEADGSTRLRLNALAMFSSGGVEVDAAQVPLLRRIAWALNQVPGRAVVVGHTDDQPVRSLKFGNNHELSSARARAVAQILSRDLDDPARLGSSGAGDSQPVVLPANRARNRRVEILYLPGVEP